MLENIGQSWNDFVFEQPHVIPTRKLVANGFTDRWIEHGFRCKADCSGPEGPCSYCDEFLATAQLSVPDSS